MKLLVEFVTGAAFERTVLLRLTEIGDGEIGGAGAGVVKLKVKTSSDLDTSASEISEGVDKLSTEELAGFF